MRPRRTIVDGIVALAQREGRGHVLEALALRLGVTRVILLVVDPALGHLLPVPGTPQTLAGGPSWRELVSRCNQAVRERAHEPLHGTVELPRGETHAATALVVHHLAMVMLGGEPARADLRGVERWLPLLASLFQTELRCVDLEAQTFEAREAAGCALGVAASVEAARAQASDARRAAEEESRALSAFLSMMSHEIRTPMNAVIGMTSLALDDAGGLDARARGYIDRAHTSAVHLLRLLNDVLDVSKIEAGRMTIERTTLRISDLFAQAEHVARPRAELKGLALCFAIDEGVPPALLGDPLRLGQVLTNLVDNAIKFTQCGAVTVRAQVLPDPVGVGQLDVQIRITVSDTGIGIDPHARKGLFQPFVQANRSTSRRYGGTGLGLSISRRLVELMGGRLWVESRPGRGSTFGVELAMRRDRVKFAVPAREVPADLGALQGLHVLLAEDDETNIVLALALLERAGVRVDVARDGQEALAMLAAAAQPYDLVLMDCQMPGLDGYGATERLRSDSRLAHLPVIAMTADVMPQDIERARRCGMNDHIAKPIELATLYSTLVRWAAGGEGSSP